jgi:hypothetical protein
MEWQELALHRAIRTGGELKQMVLLVPQGLDVLCQYGYGWEIGCGFSPENR